MHLDETTLLKVSYAQRAYVREVILSCDQRVVVFAHSVLRQASLRGTWNGITRLGSRPLGEALFKNPRIQRKAFVFRKLTHRHPLFRRIDRYQTQTTRVLWARRSVFSLNGRSLLVTEVFLHAIETL